MTTALWTTLLILTSGYCVLAGPHNVVKWVTDASTTLGLRLHQKLRDQPNIVYSPRSLHSILSLVSLGARGDTELELLNLLNWHQPNCQPWWLHSRHQSILRELASQTKVSVNIASAISTSPNVPIDPSFLEQATQDYQALVTSRDSNNLVEAENEINEFVVNRTEGGIRGILPPSSISDRASLVLASALAVKATWQVKFDPSKTKKQDFTKNDGTTVQVDMMRDIRVLFHKRDTQFNIDLVQIPFNGDQFALLLFVPIKNNGLGLLENLLSDSHGMNSLLRSMSQKKVDLTLPKFKVESQMDIKDTLRELGLVKATTPNAADFSGISDLGNQYISNVFHKAVIEVSESGVIGGSSLLAQADHSRTLSSDSFPVQCRVEADHPFMFVVQDQQYQQILLQGRFSGY